METFLIRALQLVLSLSLLVVIHEMGHFLFARLFKVRVERFAIFFHPWFKLFSYKPKNSDTEYVLGWLPLGGYVKIAGMIDESMDSEQMKRPPQPWEFRTKPAWQRLIIMLGGVVFNFILALFIYAMILFAWGDSYIPIDKVPLGMEFSEVAKEVGFQDGDVLLSADDVPLERLGSDALSQIVDARIVKVLRDGKETAVYIPEDMMQRLMASNTGFATYMIPYVVDSVMVDKPAYHAGLLPGDSIISLDGKKISFQGFLSEMTNRKEHQEKFKAEGVNPYLINLGVVRDGNYEEVAIEVDSAFQVGVYVTNQMDKLFPLVKVNYGFLASFPAGAKHGVNTLKNYVNSMKHVFSKEGAKQLGGFGTIGSIFPATWNWHQFWYMTALLSIMLAFMNILPIPALDGGHVMFLLYEIIARRKPSEQFMEQAQIIGMLILFALVIWANFNDVLRFLF